MRRYPQFAVGAVAVTVISVSGCSPDSGPETTSPVPDSPTSSPPGTTTEQATPAPPPPGEVAISPGGVTTAVGAPAESTEDDYFQACMAARTWMEQRGDDLQAQIEPYLAMVQST
ncbi:MAG: lipoprotein LpqV, partial [Actinomycetota bacterium]|nr:lipoprotein LpqV [Actinomycetota bacterium]